MSVSKDLTTIYRSNVGVMLKSHAGTPLYRYVEYYSRGRRLDAPITKYTTMWW